MSFLHTTATGGITSAAPPASAAHRRWVTPAVCTVLLCLLVALALTADRTAEVWQTGAFFDTDDAARAVQLRSWMGGQAWFDLAIHRMDPPAGSFMHWSRIVDLPLAALVAVATPLAGPDTAELIARIVFPLGCFVALLVATGSAAAAFGGSSTRLAGITLCFLGAPFLGQFVPGRIDHHAPQILLLMIAVGVVFRSFDPHRARRAALAGVAAALSLSISLENLPFLAVLCASYPLLFIWRGIEARKPMLFFAASFAVALAVLFFATGGPARWTDTSCDALSLAYLPAGLAGCGVLILLAGVAPFLRTQTARIAAVLAAAPVPLVVLWLVAPNCLGDPFVGLDPLVRDIWLHNVGEVEPLLSFLRTQPWAALAMLIPVLTGFIAAIAEAWRSEGTSRARAILLAALLLIGLAMTQWGIRAFSTVLPLVALAAAPIVRRAFNLVSLSPIGRWVAAVLIAQPFAPLALAFALPGDAPRSEGRTLSCLTPAALAPLASLPSGNVLAPIDAGAHLLAFTPHGVFGAPYHRNNAGNRLVLDAMLARPDLARRIITDSTADYVAICAESTQARTVAERAPDGLAARLLAKEVPDWLEPVLLNSPQQVYRVRRSP